jgi:hypothetical protein
MINAISGLQNAVFALRKAERELGLAKGSTPQKWQAAFDNVAILDKDYRAALEYVKIFMCSAATIDATLPVPCRHLVR